MDGPGRGGVLGGLRVDATSSRFFLIATFINLNLSTKIFQSS